MLQVCCFNSILKSFKFRKKKCHCNIILLYSNINNYCPISLISHLDKALIKVIKHRISPHLDNEKHPVQAGFCSGMSTTGRIKILSWVKKRLTNLRFADDILFISSASELQTMRSLWGHRILCQAHEARKKKARMC